MFTQQFERRFSPFLQLKSEDLFGGEIGDSKFCIIIDEVHDESKRK